MFYLPPPTYHWVNRWFPQLYSTDPPGRECSHLILSLKWTAPYSFETHALQEWRALLISSPEVRPSLVYSCIFTMSFRLSSFSPSHHGLLEDQWVLTDYFHIQAYTSLALTPVTSFILYPSVTHSPVPMQTLLSLRKTPSEILNLTVFSDHSLFGSHTLSHSYPKSLFSCTAKL